MTSVKDGSSKAGDFQVTLELTSYPGKAKIAGPLSPAHILKIVDSCTLPDLVRHAIITLIEPYVCFPKSPNGEDS